MKKTLGVLLIMLGLLKLLSSAFQVLEDRSYIDDAGWKIEHVAIDVDGHDVQSVRYDENDQNILVMTDGCIEEMTLEEVQEYMADLKGGW